LHPGWRRSGRRRIVHLRVAAPRWMYATSRLAAVANSIEWKARVFSILRKLLNVHRADEGDSGGMLVRGYEIQAYDVPDNSSMLELDQCSYLHDPNCLFTSASTENGCC